MTQSHHRNQARLGFQSPNNPCNIALATRSQPYKLPSHALPSAHRALGLKAGRIRQQLQFLDQSDRHSMADSELQSPASADKLWQLTSPCLLLLTNLRNPFYSSLVLLAVTWTRLFRSRAI